MTKHSHDVHQISFLLAGELNERTHRGDVTIATSALGFKPAGIEHSNVYGSNGALIFGLEFEAEAKVNRALELPSNWHWDHRPGASADLSKRALRKLLTGSPNASEIEDQLWDIVASFMPTIHPNKKRIPGWVLRACDQLREESIGLRELAAAEGIHPVYFSRAFTAYVGCTPSSFRSQARFHRALRNIHRGSSLCLAAIDAGYADQAHFSRESRFHTGLTPKILKCFIARG